MLKRHQASARSVGIRRHLTARLISHGQWSVMVSDIDTVMNGLSVVYLKRTVTL